MKQTPSFRTLQSQPHPDLVHALMSIGAAIAPTRNFRAVTPHNTNVISGGAARSLYIGGAGDVTVINEAGSAVTFADVPAGTILPIEAAVVKSTGTTATDIVAL
ncbi:MAG TPA: hypothetical protein VD994_01800 [Prosthecobacter sp.]|nr:hypothetical protein [Prosthecobacter sp.]